MVTLLMDSKMSKAGMNCSVEVPDNKPDRTLAALALEYCCNNLSIS